MMHTLDLVAKLWNLCHILRDDGVTYQEYLSELTWLLFPKMLEETGREQGLPVGYRWHDLRARRGAEQLEFYRAMLLQLGTEAGDPVRAIYANARTRLTVPRHLVKLVEGIDGLDWYSAKDDGLGVMYEGLLEKNACEKKSGAGQYFTPRPLVDCIVASIRPRPGEVVQDPAAGTGGFLIAADRYIKERTADLSELSRAEQGFQREQAFVGVELVPETQRLARMNLMLHDIGGPLYLGDSLSQLGADLPKADVILTNPPFGSRKGGGSPLRADFSVPTSNKQLAFLQHVYRGLKVGGRAAVVLPDNVLFEEHSGARVRAELMRECNLHTILRLPTGIFYAQGVKTNVLFFTRGDAKKKPCGEGEGDQTEAVWIYDMRTRMPAFGRRTPLHRSHFADFERLYGEQADGTGERMDQGEAGRFRPFSRADIASRGDNLDISWLSDDSDGCDEALPEPDEIAAEMMAGLRTALQELEALSDLLEARP